MRADFESRVLETGLRLYRLIEGETPSLFRKNFWTGKVMDWCMRNEAFKVQMFRFIDVFPYLTRPESVARHLREYFCGADQDLPKALQWGLKCVAPGSIAAKLVASSMAKNINGMAGQFILGATPESALPVIESLRHKGFAVAADLLGEAVVSDKEEQDYVTRYLAMLDRFGERQAHWTAIGGESELDWGCSPKINVSIKPSAMYSQMNPRAFDHSVAAAKARLQPIFEKATAMGAAVCLDMEQRELKNLSLALYKSLLEDRKFAGYPYAGIVIQAYLRDSEADLKDLIAWARARKQPVNVRLVKGAYWDAEIIAAKQRNWPIPVFTEKHETDANFEKLAGIILEHSDLVHLACASHNIRSIAYVMELKRELDVPDARVEYQILYGMAEPVRKALAAAGLPLRLYGPIGEMIPGMAYLVRRLLENTSNESFLRLTFAEGADREQLLQNPAALAASRAPEDAAPAAPLAASATVAEFQNEPGLDWTLAAQRQRFGEALREVRQSLPRTVPLVIDGRRVDTENTFVSVNPNDPEEVVARVQAASVDHAAAAIAAAAAAFPGWRRTAAGDRAEFLFRAARTARATRRQLAALQVFEVGKSWSEADADVCEAIDFLEYYGREMLRIAAPRRMGHVPGEISRLFYQPRGVGVVIAPWNFPFAISVGMSAAALVAGNTVVYKPASQSPAVGQMVHWIFEQAGLPNGVLNFLPGPGGVIGDVLVTHPEVAFIAFTGSREVGLHIIELAAKTSPGARCVKSVVAEMGGKNAIIVDADADFDEAVRYVLDSAFAYQGQKCSACSRLIVLEENYHWFLSRLKEAAESLSLGPVEEPMNFMGAVIDQQARRKIEAYLELGGKDATILVQRPIPNARGHAVPLTIFTDVPPDHPLAQEEIFGPVLSVIKVKDFDQALAVANSTPYALTGGVLSRSPEHIEQAEREFLVGNLYINRGCTGAIVGRHPFGGFRMSGIGSKAGGPDYLKQFMVPRNVVENTVRKGFAPGSTR